MSVAHMWLLEMFKNNSIFSLCSCYSYYRHFILMSSFTLDYNFPLFSPASHCLCFAVLFLFIFPLHICLCHSFSIFFPQFSFFLFYFVCFWTPPPLYLYILYLFAYVFYFERHCHCLFFLQGPRNTVRECEHSKGSERQSWACHPSLPWTCAHAGRKEGGLAWLCIPLILYIQV